MASKKRTLQEKIQDQEDRLKLLKARQEYEKAKAAIKGKK